MSEIGPYLLGPNDENEGVYTGDAQELAKHIPNNSIDMIFTDPPYPKEYLHLYGWLSSTANRILKDGMWLWAYGGMVHPDVLNLLTSHMTLHFTHILLHHGGYPRWWAKKLMVGYKPIYALTKGTPERLEWMSTVHADSMDKRYHNWGQGIGLAIQVIEQLTSPNQIILDPFAGGGTTAAACKILSRQYLSFEINPQTAQTARQRIHSTQPLFTPKYEQPKLIP